MGILILGITYGMYHPSILYALIFLIPMIFDGGIQLLTTYESTNIRRFLTGLFFGYGLFCLILISVIATFWYGYHFV